MNANDWEAPRWKPPSVRKTVAADIAKAETRTTAQIGDLREQIDSTQQTLDVVSEQVADVTQRTDQQDERLDEHGEKIADLQQGQKELDHAVTALARRPPAVVVGGSTAVAAAPTNSWMPSGW